MTKATNHTKAYVLTTVNSSSELTLAEQLKSNQFLNLLTTCNISVKLGSSLSQEVILNEFQWFFIDFSCFNDSNTIPNDVLTLAIKSKVVLFNCSQGMLDEKSALLAGIQGVFYITDRVDIILKGIENLLGNERWFKRETMNIALGELLTNADIPHQSNICANSEKIISQPLTKREKMIIKLVSSGAQNKEIANQLHISPNTVKTHIYSIFRKTSSRNRVELLSWTQKFQQVN